VGSWHYPCGDCLQLFPIALFDGGADELLRLMCPDQQDRVSGFQMVIAIITKNDLKTNLLIF
jgi:hypothetical protein